MGYRRGHRRREISPTEQARLDKEEKRRVEREAKKEEGKQKRAQAKVDKKQRFAKQHATRRKEGTIAKKEYQSKKRDLKEDRDKRRWARIDALEGDVGEESSDRKKKDSARAKKAKARAKTSKGVRDTIRRGDVNKAKKEELAKLSRREAIDVSRYNTKTRLKGKVGLADVVGEESDYGHQKELKKAVAEVASKYGKTEEQFLEDRYEGGANYTDEEKADFDAVYSKLIGGKLGQDAVTAGPKLQRVTEAKRIADRKVFQDRVTDEEVTGIKNSLNEDIGGGKTKADVMDDEGFGVLAEMLDDGKIDADELKVGQDKFNKKGDEKLESFEYDADTGSYKATLTNKKGESRPVTITEGTLRAWNEVKGKKIESDKALAETELRDKKASDLLSKKTKLKLLEGKTKLEQDAINKKFENQTKSLTSLQKKAESGRALTGNEVKKLNKDITEFAEKLMLAKKSAKERHKDGEIVDPSDITYYEKELKDREKALKAIIKKGGRVDKEKEALDLINKALEEHIDRGPKRAEGVTPSQVDAVTNPRTPEQIEADKRLLQELRDKKGI